ncbi:MAG: DNA alkylation repair protein [Paludibacteraceae bacterium]|nr:DNA alkylation repair protein [Paludibacteraceae bacterium]
MQKYLVSDKEFELRFGVVLLLDYYIDSDYIDRVLDVLGNVRHDSRYVKMAVAWALSVCVVKQREKTLTFLQERRIDKETLQMTKQKVSDSFRVSEADKAFVRGLA